MNNNNEKLNEEQQEAKRVLSRIENDSETVGTSSFVRNAEKTRNHFLGKDGDCDDPIEIWGKRIGRALSIVFVIVLALYLYNTFIVGN